MLITLGVQRDSLLAPVVQKLDRAIHQAPVVQKLDSAIQVLNNWGLI